MFGKLFFSGLAAIFGLLTQTEHTLYDFTVNTIDGQPVKLSKFKGNVVLVVNTASKCGFTPQYKGLQSLYESNKKKGFTVIAFPANDFRAQEPGTNAEIKEFCTTNYNVSFPLMSKISVVGQSQHPVYKWLIAASPRPTDEIEWNFAKFLVDRNGKVRYRFAPNESPSSKAIQARIDELLKEKPGR